MESFYQLAGMVYITILSAFGIIHIGKKLENSKSYVLSCALINLFLICADSAFKSFSFSFF